MPDSNHYTKIVLIIILAFSITPSLAQHHSEKTGAWFMYFGLNRVSEKISIHSEVQHRNFTVGSDLEQLLLRAGLNYHLKPNLMVSAGYGHISNYAYQNQDQGATAIEHRIWQQLIARGRLFGKPTEHRFRYEQRWVEGSFSQRFRYRFLVNIPLTNDELMPKTLYISLYDEIFLNIQKDGIFDRNRLFGALGYQVSKAVHLQAGYLRQTVTDFSKNYLQFAIFYNPDLRSEVY